MSRGDVVVVLEGLLVFVVRGILLWVVVPVTLVLWVVLLPVRVVRRVLFRRRHPSLSAYIHAADGILTFVIGWSVTVGRPSHREQIGIERPTWPGPDTDSGSGWSVAADVLDL